MPEWRFRLSKIASLRGIGTRLRAGNWHKEIANFFKLGAKLIKQTNWVKEGAKTAGYMQAW
jgi:hypothetical protein